MGVSGRMTDTKRMALGLLTALAWGAFKAFRAHPLSLPDPLNNPYTSLSAGRLMAFGGLWVLTLVTTLHARENYSRPAAVLSWSAVGLGGLYVAYFLFGLALFLLVWP